MSSIDILFLVPIIYSLYKGFKHGFILEICTLLALLVGVYAGIHFSDGTTHFLQNNWNIESRYLPAISFTLTFLAVGAIVFFGGKALEKVVDVANLTPANKLLGVLFASIKMCYILSVLVVTIESYDEQGHFIDQATKDESLLYLPIKNFSLTTMPRLQESTLFVRDLLIPSDSTEINLDDALRFKENIDSLGFD